MLLKHYYELLANENIYRFPFVRWYCGQCDSKQHVISSEPEQAFSLTKRTYNKGRITLVDEQTHSNVVQGDPRSYFIKE